MKLATMLRNDYDDLGINFAKVRPRIVYWLNRATQEDQEELNQYYYHKDHLGSSTQISDNDANIIQHIEYLPYGESFFERRSTWNTPYKFNAKELDEETGMYYYGARYYTPEVSIWLSVDPLADKYPSMTPYMYCGGNPVNLIDPTGMSAVIPPTGDEYTDNKITAQAQQRFESVLHNLESFTENEDFMYAITQTTGLSSNEIKEYLAYGTGPKASIIEGNNAYAVGPKEFKIGADIINYLGSINSNDKTKLGTQAFGIAMLIIDEISHNGDMAFNKTTTSTGEKENNPGLQNWSISPTWHRGGDSQLFGFGVIAGPAAYDYITPSTGIQHYSGEMIIDPGVPSNIKRSNTNNVPKIPVYNMNKYISIGLNLLK